ncbi:MAG: globin [bacterium]|nr:globin [bacterium]
MTALPGAASRVVEDEEAERLLESMDVLSGHETQLVKEFYALFFERHPEVTELFGEHSLSEQEEMVRETLISVVAWLEREPWLQTNLEAMGKSHSEYGVEDRMYDWMVECMLDALERVSGAKWRDEYEPAWRSARGHLTDVRRAAGARQARSHPR